MVAAASSLSAALVSARITTRYAGLYCPSTDLQQQQQQQPPSSVQHHEKEEEYQHGSSSGSVDGRLSL